MRTYSHKVLRLLRKEPEDLVSELDDLGRDGWRLVCVAAGKMFLIRSERSQSSSGGPNSCPIEK